MGRSNFQSVIYRDYRQHYILNGQFATVYLLVFYNIYILSFIFFFPVLCTTRCIGGARCKTRHPNCRTWDSWCDGVTDPLKSVWMDSVFPSRISTHQPWPNIINQPKDLCSPICCKRMLIVVCLYMLASVDQ